MSGIAILVQALALLQDRSGPLAPEEALKTFRLSDGYEIDLVACEP